jgi:hypothetical protein
VIFHHSDGITFVLLSFGTHLFNHEKGDGGYPLVNEPIVNTCSIYYLLILPSSIVLLACFQRPRYNRHLEPKQGEIARRTGYLYPSNQSNNKVLHVIRSYSHLYQIFTQLLSTSLFCRSFRTFKNRIFRISTRWYRSFLIAIPRPYCRVWAGLL